MISHDLNVIKSVCSRVIVMYNGDIVEMGNTQEVLRHPKHDYTKTLVAAIPDNDVPSDRSSVVLEAKDLRLSFKEKDGVFSGKDQKAVLKGSVFVCMREKFSAWSVNPAAANPHWQKQLSV